VKVIPTNSPSGVKNRLTIRVDLDDK